MCLIHGSSKVQLMYGCCLQNAVPEPPVKAQGADFSYLTDLYHGEFPKVLIQLPMYNEDAHCDLIIQRCCKIKWPSHRILIQVRAQWCCHWKVGEHPAGKWLLQWADIRRCIASTCVACCLAGAGLLVPVMRCWSSHHLIVAFGVPVGLR